MIDLDNFKHINDTYGHPIGDIIIKAVASLIKQNVRKSDVAARIGGDEFSLLLLETPIEKGLIVVEKIRKVLRETPIDIMTGSLIVKASFGVAEYPSHGVALSELIVASDVALYKAKHLGRDTVAVLDKGITEARMDMMARADDLQKALDEDRIEPFFQPVIDVKTGRVFGLDIAARIRDRDSFILAAQFKPVADELGYMDKIDAQIFVKVLSMTGDIEKKYGTGVKLFFELSAKRFFADGFAEDVLEVLKDKNCPADRILFEITEHDTLPNINRFMEIVSNLKKSGIRFSLKNFGSGFSSFMYLKYLDVSFVKIDGEFIRTMDVDNRNKILVKNMHQILAQFGITDIAEYVEDDGVHKIVEEIGIKLGQGFYYGNPEGV
ncbi:MAG: bifunctional diguanylate cyclase/phosphodiesterase [Deltaproteobacteria bacterium]|nr:bifunctional diguanylate cyclase/phosphodiesterase [Deltaproteobacteria bacterium]